MSFLRRALNVLRSHRVGDDLDDELAIVALRVD